MHHFICWLISDNNRFIKCIALSTCLISRAIEIVAQHMVTDLPSSFGRSFMDLSGAGMARTAAERCYRDSGLRPSDVDVLEVGYSLFKSFIIR